MEDDDDQTIFPVLSIKTSLTLRDEDEEMVLSNFMQNIHANTNILEDIFAVHEEEEMTGSPK